MSEELGKGGRRVEIGDVKSRHQIGKRISVPRGASVMHGRAFSALKGPQRIAQGAAGAALGLPARTKMFCTLKGCEARDPPSLRRIAKFGPGRRFWRPKSSDLTMRRRNAVEQKPQDMHPNPTQAGFVE
jgi:hypothetical protein